MRNLINKNKREGFTIIEVVLVLAIAGLIFLVVFLALPQLQESRRDNQRRRDAERLVAGVSAFQLDNDQDVPDTAAALTSGVIGSYVKDFEDPSEGSYTVVDTVAALTPDTGEIVYMDDATCVGSTATANTPVTAGSREFAVQIVLEQGNYCVDNS